MDRSSSILPRLCGGCQASAGRECAQCPSLCGLDSKLGRPFLALAVWGARYGSLFALRLPSPLGENLH